MKPTELPLVIPRNPKSKEGRKAILAVAYAKSEAARKRLEASVANPEKKP